MAWTRAHPSVAMAFASYGALPSSVTTTTPLPGTAAAQPARLSRASSVLVARLMQVTPVSPFAAMASAWAMKFATTAIQFRLTAARATASRSRMATHALAAPRHPQTSVPRATPRVLYAQARATRTVSSARQQRPSSIPTRARAFRLVRPLVSMPIARRSASRATPHAVPAPVHHPISALAAPVLQRPS